MRENTRESKQLATFAILTNSTYATLSFLRNTIFLWGLNANPWRIN
jgi:hypothetical protein